ncbi:MAG: hypothetical protein JWQ35_2663 [Bacteriovoracaceae bacterium]|nr:hypothetical protein [Bacteriovoracaceae bacterium]
MKARFRNLFFVFTSVGFLSGCGNPELESALGHYQGLLTLKTKHGVDQKLVVADLSNNSNQRALLKVKTEEGDRHWEFSISKDKNDEIWLDKTALKKVSEHCFSQKDEASDLYVRVCLEKGEIRFYKRESTDEFKLRLNKPEIKSELHFEAPTHYTKEELIRRAVEDGFDSQLRLEEARRARLSMEMAYLDLTPKISGNTILNFFSASLVGLVRAAVDLAPFAFPKNWDEASRQKYLAKAKTYELDLARLDSASVVEGLCFGTDRDVRVIESLTKSLRDIEKIRDEILERERIGGILQVGSSYDIRSVMNSIEKDLVHLKETLQSDHAFLADAVGFMNPEAIQSIEVKRNLIPDVPTISGRRKSAEIAVRQSFELREVDALIQAAKENKKGILFGWIDPSSGSNHALGLGLGADFMIAASEVNELGIKREKLSQGIIRKVYETMDKINEASESYKLAEEGIAIQEQRIDRYLTNLQIGIDVRMTDLANALEGLAKNRVDRIVSEVSYDAAQSHLNRLLISGPYSEIIHPE